MKNYISGFMKPVNTICVAGLLLFAACTNPRYINSPSVHNAAFFRQQGDFKFSAAAAGNPSKIFSSIDNEDNDESLGHSVGFDGQAAVAVSNHFMLTASGNYRDEKDHFNNDDLTDLDRKTDVRYSRHMFDFGAGFFTAMGHSEKVYFNGVLGVGFGKMSSTDVANPFDATRLRRFEANTLKYFFHPSFNFFFSDYVRMSVAPRFSLLRLNNIKTNYSESEEITLGYSDARKHTFGVFEPAILLQTGFRNNDWLKLDFGFNFASDPFTTSNSDNSEYGVPAETRTYDVQSRNFLLSIGLSVYPGRRR